MHFDNVFFLILIAVAGLFKWLAQKAQEGRKESDRSQQDGTIESSEANRPAPAGSEEERIRRFLEALGQPSSAPPPPKIKPRPPVSQKRTILPHVGPMGSPLPPLTTSPPPLVVEPVSTTLPPPLPTAIPVQVSPTRVEAEVFEIRPTQTSTSPAPLAPQFVTAATPSRLAPRWLVDPALLTSADGLRQAIVLREIFGPPRSLQADY